MFDVASDLSIDETGDFEDVIDSNIVVFDIDVLITADNNSGVLTTGVGIGRDLDGKVDFGGLVGLQGTSGLINGDPFGDFGIR